jgi:hypothetical protein
LTIPEVDPEKLIRKGKALREGYFTAELGISTSSHCPLLKTPISTSQFSIKPHAGVSRTLNFGSVPLEFFPPSLVSKRESLVTPFSPEVVPWSRPRTTKDFPTTIFFTPPPITVLLLQKEKPLLTQAL